MRKGRLIISGMLGFWLWLAGMPINHDTAGQALGGLLPRAHAADVSGTNSSETSLTGDNTVNTALINNAPLYTGDGTLTINAGATLTNSSNKFEIQTKNAVWPNNQGKLINYGTLENLAGAMIYLGGYENYGILYNYGDLEPGARSVNYGTIVTKDGSLTYFGSTNYLYTNYFINDRTGTITIESGSKGFLGYITNSGRIENYADGINFYGSTNTAGGVIINYGKFWSAVTNTNEAGGIIDNYGTWEVFSINNSGAFTNHTGASVSLRGTTYNQAGGTIVNQAGATFLGFSDSAGFYYAGLINEAGGLVQNYGTMELSGPVTNYGAIENYRTFSNINLISGSKMLNYGTITNYAGATMDSGPLTNCAADPVNNYSAGTLINYGAFYVSDGTYNYGTINNYGTICLNTHKDLLSYGVLNNYANATMYGNGAIYNEKDIYNYGTYDVTAGQLYNGWNTLYVSGASQPSAANLYNSGTLTTGDSGYIWNFGTIYNTGSVVVNQGLGAMDNYGGTVVNDGRIVNNGLFYNTCDPSSGNGWPGPLYGGTLTNNGVFLNNAGATFLNSVFATVDNRGTIYNYGTFTNKAETTVDNVLVPGTIVNSGAFYNYGTFTNSGTTTNYAGNPATTVDGRSVTATLTSTGAFYNYGTFTNSDHAIINSSGGLYNYGTFTNAATATLNITAGTVYGPIVNNGTFNVSGGTFILPAAGQTLSITSLSGDAAFRVAGITAAAPAITVTGTATDSHTLTFTGGGSAAGTVKAVDLPAGSTATFSGGGDVGAYYCTLDRGSTIGLDAEDYYLSRTDQPSALSKTAMGVSASTTTVWYGEMNEIRKRMGELRLGSQSADDFWARGYASSFRVRPAGTESYRQIMRGFELGKDNPQPIAGGKKYTGFLLGYGTADNSYASGASGTTTSAYLGAYGSWLRDDGSYVDIIGKFNRFTPRFTTASDSGKYNSGGLGLSAEIGKRIEQGGGRFIEPAAELSAMWARRASYTTAGGLAVEVPSAMSLQLRLGLTAGGKWQGADGASREVYVKASWVNEYKGDSTTRVDGSAFDSSIKGHQWVAGLGFVEETAHGQIYFDAEKSWGRSVSKEWGVNAGMRWKF